MRYVAVALHSRILSRKVICAIVDMRAGSPEALRSRGAGTLRHAPVWTWRLRYAAVALHSVILLLHVPRFQRRLHMRAGSSAPSG
jgi:hypothetical protein